MNDYTDTRQFLSKLYDQLSRFIVWKNFLTQGSRFASLTMHKTLQIPPEKQSLYDQKSQSEYVNDLAVEAISLAKYINVLDAGCGFGGTIFRCSSRRPGHYVGFSLSPYQIKIARHQAKKRGISSHCHFFVKNYEDPITERYHVILAIESLIHARNLSRAMENLTASLVPDGQLIIIEDMAAEDLPSDDSNLLLLKKSWLLNQFPRQTDYLAHFQRNEMQLVKKIDLTEWVKVGQEHKVKSRKRKLQFLQRILPFQNINLLINAFIGGLALEELYRCHKARYMLLVGQKK